MHFRCWEEPMKQDYAAAALLEREREKFMGKKNEGGKGMDFRCREEPAKQDYATVALLEETHP